MQRIYFLLIFFLAFAQVDGQMQKNGPQHAPFHGPVNFTTRTPSMSREAIKAAPSQQIPKEHIAPSRPHHTGPAAKEQFKPYLKRAEHPLKKGTLAQKQQEVKKSFQESRQSHQLAASKVNKGIESRHPLYHRWFDDNFFQGHQYHPNYYHRNQQWWMPVPWTTIANWLPWNWAEPIYYDEAGYPIPLPPTLIPAEPSAPEESLPNDWLPLGIFAAGKDVDQAVYSNMFVQLALDKEGDIAGTYYNATTDQTHPLEGAVDNETQQVVWKVADQPLSPVMKTGLYNLSQDVVTVQVIFPDGTVQLWVLVRLP